MKKLILTVGVLLCAATAEAGDNFGASLKPDPQVTLFGQKLSWPIPSLCLGAKAGVTPDFKASSNGIKFRVPYVEVELPFPSLLVGSKTKKIEVKPGAITKTKQE